MPTTAAYSDDEDNDDGNDDQADYDNDEEDYEEEDGDAEADADDEDVRDGGFLGGGGLPEQCELLAVACKPAMLLIPYEPFAVIAVAVKGS